MKFLKSLFSLILCLAASAVFAQVDLNNGLQAYYPFNGNANDASGHGNNAVITNATLTSDYYGKAFSAYYFNGTSSFIQIPNSSSLNSSSALSVCAWFKPQGFYLGKCHGNRIVMKGLDGNNTLGNYLLTFDDRIYTNGLNCVNSAVDTLHESPYAYGTVYTAATDTPYIQSNVWQSMVYTYDGFYVRMYLDCQLITETYNPGLSFNNAYDLFIGKMDDPQYPYYFNGIIDEVRIYNRALSTDEVKAYSPSCAAAQTLCTGSLGDPIVNITFGSGNNPGSQLSTIVPGASTTYNFVSVSGNPASPIPEDGSYTITNNVPANSNWFEGATDHTGNANGYMAFFNANPTPGEFYRQTVTGLCPGTSYQFSAWIANVLDPSQTIGILPDVTFRIEKTDGTFVASYKTGGIPQSSSMTWGEYGFFFTTPADGNSVVLKMINTNVGGIEQPGNDFAVDDITFRACTAQLTASFSSGTLKNSLTVCPNTTVTLYGDANPQTGNYDYLWQVSNDNGATWTDIANSNKISISVTAPSQTGATFLYRMLSSQKGNINSKNCRGASNTVALTISGLCTTDKLPCTNWYYNTNETGAFRSGDLDVTGHTITVEANINRTAPYDRPDNDTTLDGDVVSKHRDESNVNYLLRANRCEITTTNGHFRTPPVCRIELNKTYQVAMTYDGQTLKFYRNGYLMSSVPATGELITNDYQLTIGSLAYQPGYDYTAFKGYINNVKIWNVVRTQSQIKTYMDSTLPNPASQTGLLAYYLFDDVLNKQGNPAWDGSLINGAVINQTNPTCGSFVADSCRSCKSDWLKVNSNGSGVKAGDIDVTGQKITVEATFNSTEAHSGGRLYAGDIVSKHAGPNTINYLLRPSSAEITTSNGYFITPVICDAELNKTYQVAMVYDGSTLKFYRNGYLMSQVSCTGDLYQNNYITTIGANASNPSITPDESFGGYINEVKIWNIVRTQNEIKQYINQSLPNPQGQTGLIAYYTFANLNNKQGNAQWNASLINNNAVINQPNPTCDSIFIDSCGTVPVITPVVTPVFTAPDTVCVNTPFTVSNTTLGATTDYWNFCQPNLLDKSAITNLGNFQSNLNFPVYTDYVLVNGKYYMFLVNNNSGGSILRLDYGNSLLNTPTVVRLNNVSTYLSGNTEGIQLVQNNGRWYAIVVGGDPQSFHFSQILKLDFGADITNASPTVTDWGNPGNLLNYPHELYVFKESNHWYGFTANTYGNNVVKFDFGTDFSATPAASVVLTNFMNYPVGLYAYSKNTNRYLFIVNAGTSNATSTLVRLDFGSSYTYAPTVNNLGNLGGNLGAYDFTTVETCGQLMGMSARASDDAVARFTFPGADITKTPVFLDTIASGQLRFPHSFSKIYHEGSDSYFFIPNAFGNTFSRLKISGCTAASPAGSSSANPGTISYNAPGTYTISLTVDEGLQTGATACKNILVVPVPKQAPPKDTSFCEGTSVRLSVPSSGGKFLWNTGSTDTAITVSQPGKYWVQISNGNGCGVVDSFNVATRVNPVVNLGKDTGLCKNGTLVLNAGNTSSTYIWQDGSTKQTYTATKGGTYYVMVTNAGKCSKTDTVKIADYPSPVVTGLSDARICSGNSAQLSVTANGTGNTYSWTPASTLNNSTAANPTAKPIDTTSYTVTVTNSTGCITKDTATVFVLPKPVVTSIADTGFCAGNSVTLQTVIANASSFVWSPSAGLNNAATQSPKATPVVTTPYIITGTNEGCSVSDTVKLTVFALPAIVAGNDTTVCGNTSVQLSANGGNQYRWSPATGLSNPNIASPVASVSSSITYIVTGTDNNGCVNKDSVHILNRALTQFVATTTMPVVCAGDSVLLKASGGDTYAWQPSESVLRPADSLTYAIPTASTTYTVQISDNQCKISDTKEVAVTVNQRPQIMIAKSNDIDCRQKEATLTVSGGASYAWSPAVADSINGMSTVMVAPEETTIYKVTATSDKGCVSTDTVTVKVNIDLENQYPIQNAFTPNGDGINDCFGIKAWNVIKVDFEIFDRWGWLLFHSTDPQNVCWDGRYNGKNQLDGTYVYKIYAVTACGIINKAGPFVLIRAAR